AHSSSHVFFLLLQPPPISTLFPYTTLFRSDFQGRGGIDQLAGPVDVGQEVDNLVRIDLQPWAAEHFSYKIVNFQYGRGNANQNSDRKSTRLNSSHVKISYAVFCLKKKRTKI